MVESFSKIPRHPFYAPPTDMNQGRNEDLSNPQNKIKIVLLLTTGLTKGNLERQFRKTDYEITDACKSIADEYGSLFKALSHYLDTGAIQRTQIIPPNYPVKDIFDSLNPSEVKFLEQAMKIANEDHQVLASGTHLPISTIDGHIYRIGQKFNRSRTLPVLGLYHTVVHREPPLWSPPSTQRIA